MPDTEREQAACDVNTVPHDPRDVEHQRTSTSSAIVLTLGLTVMLMIFSLVAALIHETALATMAGTAAVTLASDIVRRVGRPFGDQSSPIHGPERGHPSHKLTTLPVEQRLGL